MNEEEKQKTTTNGPTTPSSSGGSDRSTSDPSSGSGDSGGSASTGGSSGSGGQGSATGPDGAPRKRRRRGKRGGRRHRKKPAGEGTSDANGSGSSGGSSGAQRSGGSGSRSSGGARSTGATEKTDASKPASTSNRPKSTGGSSRSKAAEKPATKDAPKDDAAPKDADAPAPDSGGDGDAGEGTSSGAPRRRRRRGGRGRGGRGKGGGQGGNGQGGGSSDGEKKAAASSGGSKSQSPKAGSGSRKGGSSGGSNGGGSTRLAARQQRRQQQRRRPRKRLTEEEAQQLRGRDKTMLVHQHEDRTQIAILEEDTLIEHYVARAGQRTTMAGNVYMGKVQNVLPGMEAAFVDFGRGRNGVLYAGEVNYSKEDLEGDQAPRIEQVLKNGQKIMVQVTKDPIGNKGARLTTQVSLAGRYMVLAPDQRVTGISRRLAEKERNRLRQFLKDMRPEGHGVIIRTAAEGASRDALEHDLKNLLRTWEGIQKSSKRAKAPSELYGEPDLVTRVIRDEFSEDFVNVIVDTRDTYESVKEYLETSAPDLLPKLELHEGSLPLFEHHRVTEQLHKALERKVWLPSGGSLIIERTEALTVIDVNTGKFTGKGSTLEETVFANNLEAAEEIARQLRLRDIGGIIVVDFIDMIDTKNQKELLRTLKRSLSKDKTRSQVFEVSNLGLVEMTRKKVSEGLLDAFSEPCPNCEGRGIVLTHDID